MDEKRRLGVAAGRPSLVDTDVAIGRYIVFYCKPVPTDKVQRSFGIGKVVELIDNGKVKFKWFNSTDSGHWRGWRTWTGKNAIGVTDLQHVILARDDKALWRGKSAANGRCVVQSLREKILAGVEQHETGVAAEDSADNEEEEIRSEEQLAEEDDC